jgi:hypothetical protein
MRLLFEIERVVGGRGKPEINRPQKGAIGTRKENVSCVSYAFLCGKGVLAFSSALCWPFVSLRVLRGEKARGRKEVVNYELRVMNRDAVKQRKSLILPIFADIC